MLILSVIFITSCQLTERDNIGTEDDIGIAQETTNVTTLTVPAETEPEISTPTPTSISSPTVTPTATATATQTPTPTLTPTNTPVPSDRLIIATRAFHNGAYEEAQANFDALNIDPGATLEEQQLALYWRGRSESALNQYTLADVTFETFAEAYPDHHLAPVAHFQRGLALEQLGFYTETIAAYKTSFQPADVIAPYIYERMGDLSLFNEDYQAAAEWYLEALNRAAAPSFQVHLREGVAEAYLGLERFDDAMAQYDSILDIASIPAYRAKILRLTGEAYQLMGDDNQAQAQYQLALDDYPDAYESYLGLVNMVNAGMVVDEFQRGYTDYYGGNAYYPAITAMEGFIASDPALGADQAQWIIALSWRALGEYDNAIAAFERLIALYPDSEFWGDAHIQRARTLGWQGYIDQAASDYRRFVSNYPDHPLAPGALWRAALLELYDDQFQAAYTNFHAMTEQYPDSTFTDNAHYWGGLAAYMSEDYVNAEAEWTALLDNFPASDFAQAASYWQAKALWQQGEPEPAGAILAEMADQTTDYYGARSRDLLLSEDMLSNWATAAPISVTPLTTQQQIEAEAWLADWLGLDADVQISGLDPQIQNDPDFILAEALHLYGLTDEALEQYEVVQDNWDDNALAQYQLSLVFQERGAYRLSITSAARLVWLSPATNPADVPVMIRRLVYPTYYQDLVLPQAEIMGLDSALIFALIRQESLYESTALSIGNARGLMQIIPPTGSEIASRTNTTDYTLPSLWEPDRNIEFGAWYLRQMLDFLDNHQFAALAAYNAGPGRVQSWLPLPEDLDIFVAMIPLSEPQSYILRIYANLAQYREIYQ